MISDGTTVCTCLAQTQPIRSCVPVPTSIATHEPSRRTTSYVAPLLTDAITSSRILTAAASATTSTCSAGIAGIADAFDSGPFAFVISATGKTAATRKPMWPPREPGDLLPRYADRQRAGW